MNDPIPTAPPKHARDAQIDRLRAQVAELTRGNKALARRCRRLERHVDELTTQLEFVP